MPHWAHAMCEHSAAAGSVAEATRASCLHVQSSGSSSGISEVTSVHQEQSQRQAAMCYTLLPGAVKRSFSTRNTTSVERLEPGRRSITRGPPRPGINPPTGPTGSSIRSRTNDDEERRRCDTSPSCSPGALRFPAAPRTCSVLCGIERYSCLSLVVQDPPLIDPRQDPINFISMG